MSLRHGLLAVFMAAIWGLNFVVIDYALREFPPLLLAAMRFAIVGVFALFLPRPRARLSLLIAAGLVLFALQFGLLFAGMAVGMSAGLAAVVLQIQAPVSLGIGAWLLRERPSRRQIAGTCMALAGMALLAGPQQIGTPLVGFMLVLGAGVSWAIGNLFLRRIDTPSVGGLIAWLSLVPPLPLLTASLAIDGPGSFSTALSAASWVGIGSVLYVAVGATLLAYTVWGRLLRIYPTATVAPFSILALPFALLSSSLWLGERLSAMQLLAAMLVLCGLLHLALRRRPGMLLR
jgi:O-acetylserine/cysteine efflux transporter